MHTSSPMEDPPADVNRLPLSARFRYAALRTELRQERNPAVLLGKALKLVDMLEAQQALVQQKLIGDMLQRPRWLPPAGEGSNGH